ncbi:putative protein C10orf88 like [Crotalus adamanteus]|uniref:Uncharacterized protein n=1 Tax=Crotalus adamanteus TaxID=8729 RepID=A0AAW1BF18_CROAD
MASYKSPLHANEESASPVVHSDPKRLETSRKGGAFLKNRKTKFQTQKKAELTEEGLDAKTLPARLQRTAKASLPIISSNSCKKRNASESHSALIRRAVILTNEPRRYHVRFIPAAAVLRYKARVSYLAMASSSSRLTEAPQDQHVSAGWDVSASRPRVSVACSWECRSDLAGVLCIVPAGQFDAGELSEPAPSGQNVVVLEGQINDDGVVPCLLYLHCDPCGSEEIVSLSIISEARNMEVYLGDEYYATGRGEKTLTVKHGSKDDQVSLYKKHLTLECSTVSCKIKLLSISEKQKVLINKIIVQVQSACAKTVPSVTLGSGIDLDKVQSIMESMGSKLSPGAQQLLDMVRFQQKNGISFGGKLQTILGGNGFVKMEFKVLV